MQARFDGRERMSTRDVAVSHVIISFKAEDKAKLDDQALTDICRKFFELRGAGKRTCSFPAYVHPSPHSHSDAVQGRLRQVQQAVHSGVPATEGTDAGIPEGETPGADQPAEARRGGKIYGALPGAAAERRVRSLLPRWQADRRYLGKRDEAAVQPSGVDLGLLAAKDAKSEKERKVLEELSSIRNGSQRSRGQLLSEETKDKASLPSERYQEELHAMQGIREGRDQEQAERAPEEEATGTEAKQDKENDTEHGTPEERDEDRNAGYEPEQAR